MKYKLIAMDFDGTLLTDEKKLTSYTKEVLLKYKKIGYVIVGVTARPLDSVKDVLDIAMFNYLILNNGSYVYDVKNDKGEYKATISKKNASDITKKVDEFNAKVDYCSGISYYSSKANVENQRTFIKTINSVEEVKEDIAKMNVFLLDQEKIECCCDLINSKYKEVNCFIMQDSNDSKKWLVINPKGLNKAVSLNELGKKLKIDSQEMIFFGDGSNDLQAIELVGCGVAMGNALEKIKEKASAIALSNNEDGIAIFLEKNIKLK